MRHLDIDIKVVTTVRFKLIAFGSFGHTQTKERKLEMSFAYDLHWKDDGSFVEEAWPGDYDEGNDIWP